MHARPELKKRTRKAVTRSVKTLPLGEALKNWEQKLVQNRGGGNHRYKNQTPGLYPTLLRIMGFVQIVMAHLHYVLVVEHNPLILYV